ncbi:MAG TPA: hypothetical protein VLX31_13995 [Streptosporangiaceae bacterium]|nr:hypothetical protein [Streptosporangiaceae bacterium]
MSVFVHTEMGVNLPFEVACAKLSALVGDGRLTGASEHAYDSGVAGLVRVGPFGAAPGISKLVRVSSLDLARHEDRAVLTLRWEATGAGGGLFPALDADTTLTPAGDGKSLLALDGVYRPPLAALGASLDRVILHRVATSTVRSLLSEIAAAITAPPAESAVGRDAAAAQDFAENAAAQDSAESAAAQNSADDEDGTSALQVQGQPE